ncbi:hypothetical protein L2E82_49025 [Cichorium intybus]|uniref:Uncharacterized protein n=1 Tax=Cichorium intybus TaxID=13427 RepID=A0ACB8YZG0_CICIN|nr:hypothetical protein L2E82_49025 [Cichorium intybus]
MAKITMTMMNSLPSLLFVFLIVSSTTIVGSDSPFIVAYKKATLNRLKSSAEKVPVSIDIYNQGSASRVCNLLQHCFLYQPPLPPLFTHLKTQYDPNSRQLPLGFPSHPFKDTQIAGILDFQLPSHTLSPIASLSMFYDTLDLWLLAPSTRYKYVASHPRNHHRFDAAITNHSQSPHHFISHKLESNQMLERKGT